MKYKTLNDEWLNSFDEKEWKEVISIYNFVMKGDSINE